MKKLLLYIFTVFILISCSDDLSNEQWIEGTGKKVKLSFKVNIPEMSSPSRSFGSPSVANLYLIVFDNNGYYVEKVKAEKESTQVSSTSETEFTVTLTASATPRNIHFIGNYNGAEQLTFGSESDVVGSMKHTDNQDAYWQRKNYGVIADGTELGTIPLIRNHAKITLKNESTNFILKSFTIVNIVTEGYVSPYNMNNGSFAQFIDVNEDGTYTLRDYDDITSGGEGYVGYVPGTAELNLKTTIDNEDIWIMDTNEDKIADSPFYLYERRFETNNHTFMIVKGQYIDANGTTHDESYYKVDLVYKDNNNVTQYYNILRNFHYAVTINNVTGDGKESATEAYDMSGAHNNLTASIELQSLTNISDGVSRLYVSYTEETIVSSEPITLLYKYVPSVSQSTINNNTKNQSGVVDCIWEEGEVIESLSIAESDETGSNTGWRAITITPKEPDTNEAKKQTITLIAGNLSRTITYILRTPYIMNIECYDGSGTDKTDKEVEEDMQEKVNVDITIPANLPESLFPLTFFVEAEKRTLYPDASKGQKLPVGTDIPSLFDGGATFGYNLEVTWDMYYNAIDKTYNRNYSCYLLTNTESNASRIRVFNKYFSVAEDYFTNSGTTYYTLPIVVSNDGTNLPTNDNTIITIYYTNGTIMGNTTWGELKAGTAAVLTTVDTTNQNSSFGYFAYTKDGKVYKTGNMNIEQLDNTLNFN